MGGRKRNERKEGRMGWKECEGGRREEGMRRTLRTRKG